MSACATHLSESWHALHAIDPHGSLYIFPKFGVSAKDAAIFTIVALALALIAMFASYIPALRAARPDPIAVLRQE